MKQTARPAGALPKLPSNHNAASLAAAFRQRAAARPWVMSEMTRLVCAASLAVVLGVACGLWMFARLAAASSKPRAATLQPQDARAAAVMPGQPAPAAEVVSVERKDGDASSSSSPVAAPATPPRAAVLAASRTAAPHGLDATKRDAAPTKAVETVTDVKGAAAASSTREAAPRPCALYASAGSLSLRGGGATQLVLGGPGRVTVTTPDWSDIAVFDEGRTGAGARAWSKYTVRSVSGRAGSYTLNVKSPCGSQTVPVRVAPR